MEKEKKKIAVNGITLGRMFDYFFIYSIIGLIIETIYALLVYGVLESRKSFLYGPFCAIYGLGAVVMIVALNKKKDSNIQLFIWGFIIGSIVEYAVHFFAELIFNVKWWDYSERAFNINGRICLAFSFFWGILAVFLITVINPLIDKILDKIPPKLTRILTTIGIVVIIVDCIITCFAIKIFISRLVTDYDLNIKNKERYVIENNAIVQYFSDNFFTNEKMLKTFPNMTLLDENGEIIWVKDILKDIKPYYYKFN